MVAKPDWQRGEGERCEVGSPSSVPTFPHAWPRFHGGSKLGQECDSSNGWRLSIGELNRVSQLLEPIL